MLHLGGRIGEGVIAGTGLLPEVIKDTVARVHAGAREAGREPSGVDIWFTTRTVARRGPRHGHRARQGLGVVDPEPLHALRPRRQARAGRPAGEGPGYVDGYVLYDHVLHGGPESPAHGGAGPDGLRPRRFALAGDPRDWIARIEELAEAGATKLWVGLAAATSTGSATT